MFVAPLSLCLTVSFCVIRSVERSRSCGERGRYRAAVAEQSGGVLHSSAYLIMEL